MSLSSTTADKLRKALKARNSLEVSVLRMLRTALHNEEIAKKRELTEDEELMVLSREAKKRREAAEAYRSGGREASAEKEEQELGIVKQFLPPELTADELSELVCGVIAEIGACGSSDLGRVMGVVMAKAKGRVDGSMVRGVVEEELTR